MIQWGINKDQQQIRRYTGRTKGKTYIEPTNLNRSKKIKENNSTKNQWGSTTKPQSQEANSHSQEQKRKKNTTIKSEIISSAGQRTQFISPRPDSNGISSKDGSDESRSKADGCFAMVDLRGKHQLHKCTPKG